MRQMEHQNAVALVNWWRLWCPTAGLDTRLFVAIPNGGHRHIGQAMKLKAEGVTPGAPDYFLFYSCGGYHGLAIELKHEKGVLSKAQKEFLFEIERQGYKTFVAYGWDAARQAIENYVRFGRIHSL